MINLHTFFPLTFNQHNQTELEVLMLSSATSSGWDMAPGFSAFQSSIDGTILFRQGDCPQSAFFVVSGWVGSVRIEQDGQEKGVALYPPGLLPSLAELFARQDSPETVMTLSSCRLYRIDAGAFFDLIETDSQFFERIFRALCRQNYALKICSAQSSSLPLRPRLEQLFWQLLQAQSRDGAEPNGAQGECKLLAPATNKYLAQMLGVTPEYFSLTLGMMEKEGVLRRRKGRLTFLAPERLWRAPEIEGLVESIHRQTKQFTLADPIYA
jgi:CRP-like cAMP-binding protein